jgi:hypothetical protein
MATNLPGKRVDWVYDENEGVLPIRITVTSVPAKSSLVSKDLSVSVTDYRKFSSSVIFVLKRANFSFTPDASGVYEFLVTMPDSTTVTRVLEVATKLTRKIGTTVPAYVVIYVQQGVVVEGIDSTGRTPRLERVVSSRGQFLQSAMNVKSALSSMVGATAEQLPTFLHVLEQAWEVAVASNAPSVSNQSETIGVLLGGGWELV